MPASSTAIMVWPSWISPARRAAGRGRSRHLVLPVREETPRGEL